MTYVNPMNPTPADFTVDSAGHIAGDRPDHVPSAAVDAFTAHATGEQTNVNITPAGERGETPSRFTYPLPQPGGRLADD